MNTLLARLAVAIAIPRSNGVKTGNLQSAQRWANMLRDHVASVVVTEDGTNEHPDLLIVLHGLKGRGALLDFRAQHASGKVILVLTGTDIYGDGDGDGNALLDSMNAADRLVVLQASAMNAIPDHLQAKTHLIPQAVIHRASTQEPRSIDPFLLCVVGHLREVKDPLRAAAAARLLLKQSRVRVLHAGGILEPQYETLVQREMNENSRYEYIGELPPVEARSLIARCQGLVLSSHSEGGPAVIGEAVIAGTPILSTNIDGVVGLLGEDYPGYFEVGDTSALATLIQQLEADAEFRSDLQRCLARAAPQFSPTSEERAWLAMVHDLIS